MGAFFTPAEDELARIEQVLTSLHNSLQAAVQDLDGFATELADLHARVELLEGTEPPPPPPPPPPPSGEGIWLSQEEVKARPVTGEAWNRLVAVAQGSWGTADLGDNNSPHDVATLAGALYAVRTGDSAMWDKVVGGLESAMQSRLTRALELGRGLQAYVIAADLIGYHDAAFNAWVEKVVTADIQGHSGVGLLGTASNAPNNWGGMARASLAAAALYLGREDWLNLVVKGQKEMLGLPVENPTFVYQSTNWHADLDNKAGVNRKGAIIQGIHVSGVLPEDWRRAGSFSWPHPTTTYEYEGTQGLLVTAVILHRAGVLPFDSGDNAIVRVFDMLYGTGESSANNPVFYHPAAGDDQWQPWVVNHYAGTNYPTTPDTNPGKGMGWAEWAFARS